MACSQPVSTLPYLRALRRVLAGAVVFVNLVSPAVAQTARGAEKTTKHPQFSDLLARDFDYAAFTRYDAPAPPANRIFQSNGFLALEEGSFGKQIVLIPAPVDEAPTNTGDRVLAMEIDAPVFTNASGQTYNFADSPAKRNITYYADRTIYRAAFDGGPEISYIVYPIYGKSAAVLRLKVEKTNGPIRVTQHTQGKGFQIFPGKSEGILEYGSPCWPYRLLELFPLRGGLEA